jgi:8-oxo-dGTP pyrophosphatase MutT (NUDIX family)
MIYVNARAIVERKISDGIEIVIQTRNKPGEPKSLELPGGRLEEFESFTQALAREVREETGLEVTHIESISTGVETKSPNETVECMQPFAVYQTTKGPVDSMGVYFRCRAEGVLLNSGDDTENIRWISVQQLRAMFHENPEQFCWVNRAGILFYLKSLENQDV